MPGATRGREERRPGIPRRLRMPLLLLLLTLLAYLPALNAGFIWDDDRYVVKNALVRAADGLPAIWFSGGTKDFYPLLYSSFWLQWRLWGDHPFGYHAVNILLHAVNAVLLGFVLKRLRVAGAWIVAALFAVHPLNVESVAWVSQQKNTLAMVMLLLAALAWLRWCAQERLRGYAGALVFFVGSLLAKPVAIMFPAVLLLHAWWRRRGAWRTTLLETLPFFALSAFYGAVTVVFQQGHSIKGQAVGADTLLGQAAGAARALLFYIGKTLWPADLCMIYALQPNDAVSVPDVIALAAVGVCGVLLVVAAWRGWRGPLFAAGYYVLMLFPVLGFIGVGFHFYSLVADHWVYAALPAVLVGLVWCGRRLARLLAAVTPRIGMWAAGAAVLALAFLTAAQASLYRDQRTLFETVVEQNPRAWGAHVILGNEAFSRGELDEAEARYRTALRLNPVYWEALNGLGIVHATRGELKPAIELFERVLTLRPDHAHARRNLRQAKHQLRRRAGDAEP